MDNHKKYMQIALEEAQKAYDIGEVPVGAVVVINDEIVARAHNKRETTQLTMAHAEMLAIKEANEKVGFWRLEDAIMYVTLEPCAMCAGALVQARFKSIVYGANDMKSGCVGTICNLADYDGFNHKIDVTRGVMAQECSDILKNFFKELRYKKRKLKET